MMLGSTVAALLVLPVALLLLAAADLLRGRGRLPSVRTYLFVLQYLINDSAEILLAPIYWTMAGLGTGLAGTASIQRHRRLQQWSVDLLARRAEQLLGLRLEIADEDLHELIPGPAIVISRHVSLFDASIPGLLYQRQDYDVRGIIMAEMLADPGFDLLYRRLGSVFIPRDHGGQARAAIEAMSVGADDRTAFVLFPEGRLYRPEVRDRIMGRLAASDPARAERLAGLRHLLPPRPGGFTTLLGANPAADVVLIDHRGLDRYRRLSDLAKAAPVSEPVEVAVRRFARSDLPDDADEQAVWLDDLWLALDGPPDQRPGQKAAGSTPGQQVSDGGG